MKLHMMNSTIMWVFVSVSAFGVFFILLVIMILQLKDMMNENRERCLQKIESDNFGVSDNDIRIEVCTSLFLKRGDC